MGLVDKLQPVLIIASMLLGLLIGAAFGGAAAIGADLVEPLLALMLFVLFTTVDLSTLRTAFGNARFAAADIAVNFVVNPLVAWGLATLFFPDSIEVRIGLIMMLVTPCTDWYLIFTRLAHGNVELGVSVLPLNLILQLVMLPVYLIAFEGANASFDITQMLCSIAFILLIPIAGAAAVRLIARRTSSINRVFDAQGDNLQLLFLCLAVVAMCASQGSYLLQNPGLLGRVFLPLLVFFAVALAASQLLARLLGMPRADGIALSFTSLARNAPVALAVAVAALPGLSLAHLTLVVGPLIELPVLALVVWLFNRRSSGRARCEGGS